VLGLEASPRVAHVRTTRPSDGLKLSWPRVSPSGARRSSKRASLATSVDHDLGVLQYPARVRSEIRHETASLKRSASLSHTSPAIALPSPRSSSLFILSRFRDSAGRPRVFLPPKRIDSFALYTAAPSLAPLCLGALAQLSHRRFSSLTHLVVHSCSIRRRSGLLPRASHSARSAPSPRFDPLRALLEGHDSSRFRSSFSASGTRGVAGRSNDRPARALSAPGSDHHSPPTSCSARLQPDNNHYTTPSTSKLRKDDSRRYEHRDRRPEPRPHNTLLRGGTRRTAARIAAGRGLLVPFTEALAAIPSGPLSTLPPALCAPPRRTWPAVGSDRP